MHPKYIAKVAGFSQTTIFFLNNEPPKVSEKPRSKVQHILDEYRSRPNLTARMPFNPHTGIRSAVIRDPSDRFRLAYSSILMPLINHLLRRTSHFVMIEDLVTEVQQHVLLAYLIVGQTCDTQVERIA